MLNTLLAYVDPQQPDPQTIALAAQVLQEGGLVAFPTETVYGLGANALASSAVDGIFEAKQRPTTDPLIVHIADLEQIERVAVVHDARVWALAQRFWAGALTLILPKAAGIPANVTAGQGTVAIRMPSHPIAQALIRAADLPIAAPSANRFSRPSPTTAQHVLSDLNGRVNVILDGGRTPIGVESTILDLSGETPTVLRAGGVTLESLRELLPNVQTRTLYMREGETAPAPGTLLKHYAPNVETWVFRGENTTRVLSALRAECEAHVSAGRKVGVLLVSDALGAMAGLPAQILLLGETSAQVAQHLFHALRTLEAREIDVLLVQSPPDETGLGLAVLDRLYRASEGRVIDVP